MKLISSIARCPASLAATTAVSSMRERYVCSKTIWFAPIAFNLTEKTTGSIVTDIMQVRQQIKKGKIIIRASLRQRLVSGAVLLGVLGFFAFVRLEAAGRINLPGLFEPCGFKQQYGLPCPTCGVTTSSIAFVQGHIFQSFYIQPAAALAWVMLCVTAFFAFLMCAFGLYFRPLMSFLAGVKTKHVILAVIIIIAGGWVVTLARALAAG